VECDYGNLAIEVVCSRVFGYEEAPLTVRWYREEVVVVVDTSVASILRSDKLPRDV
jgi:hypothetical protein